MFEHVHNRRLDAYRFITGLFGLTLICATFPLWLPQKHFPQVPLVGELPVLGHPATWPPATQMAALSMMILGICGLTAWPFLERSQRWQMFGGVVRWCFPIGFVLAVVLDQHRLQPWAVQLLALNFLLFDKLDDDSAAIRLWLSRWLVVGIYFWSAIGKFDFQFIHTVGPEMIGAVIKMIGLDAAEIGRLQLAQMALLLPAFELVTALFLTFRRTRRVGVLCSICMHVGLLVVLGPFGLNHYPGVLIWNLYFVFQALILFSCLVESKPSERTHSNLSLSDFVRRHLVATLFVTAIIVLPFLERFGYYDHWLSWALYAPHSSRVELRIPAHLKSQLPDSLELLVTDDCYEQPGKIRLPLDRWSLDSLWVPIYPQGRFQLGVAIEVCFQSSLERGFTAELRSASDRISGQREVEEFHNRYELVTAARGFFLNALPSHFVIGKHPGA